MKRLVLAAIGLLALASLGLAQTFEQYLALRKQHGITQVSGVPALSSFVGSRVLEVSGTITGSMKAGQEKLLILDAGQGKTLFVHANNVPTWLDGSRTTARLLIHADRNSETSQVKARLLGAAPEGRMAAYDAQTAPAPAATRPAGSQVSRNAPQIKAPSGAPASVASAREALPYYAAFIKNTNGRLSDREALSIAESILGYSLEYGVDARLIMAMVMTESGFRPDATSHKGAMGLGQLMPGTARGLGVSNAYDTDQNLYGTIKLVRKNLDTYTEQTGDDYEGLVLALAAYNAGGGNVRKHGGVPPFRETQNYIRKVISLYKQFCGIPE